MFIVYPSRKQESYDQERDALKLNNHHGTLQGRRRIDLQTREREREKSASDP